MDHNGSPSEARGNQLSCRPPRDLAGGLRESAELSLTPWEIAGSPWESAELPLTAAIAQVDVGRGVGAEVIGLDYSEATKD